MPPPCPNPRRDPPARQLLPKLGKHKMSGGCLHIKRLSDVDMAVLGKVIAASVVPQIRAALSLADGLHPLMA